MLVCSFLRCLPRWRRLLPISECCIGLCIAWLVILVSLLNNSQKGWQLHHGWFIIMFKNCRPLFISFYNILFCRFGLYRWHPSRTAWLVMFLQVAGLLLIAFLHTTQNRWVLSFDYNYFNSDGAYDLVRYAFMSLY